MYVIQIYEHLFKNFGLINFKIWILEDMTNETNCKRDELTSFEDLEIKT